jgi:uncharacterized Zn-binding protein involved in type VI secretion
MGFLPITTIGSEDTLGRTVILGAINVLSANKPVSRIGDIAVSPGAGTIVGPGNPLILVNGRPVSRMLDAVTPVPYWSIIIKGNLTVLV